MNEQLLYEAELRERAALATAVAGVLSPRLEVADPKDAPALSLSETRRLDRMRELLADSAQGSGLGGELLVGIEVDLRPRPQEERRDVYELVQNLNPELADSRAVVKWTGAALRALRTLQDESWNELSQQERAFLRTKFLPFLRRLSRVDQDIDESRPTVAYLG